VSSDDSAAVLAGEVFGQQTGRGVGEDVAVGDMVSGLVGLDDDARHHEGGAAQLKEVVGSANLVHGEDVSENLAEEFLDLGGRLHILVVGGLDDGRGQRLAVHLLVLVERDGVNLHCGGRNHVRRFLLADEVVELLDVDLLVADDVGGDVLAAILIVEGLHRGILDAGELADDGLHLLQLDAEATDLHLAVLAPDKLDVAVREVTDDVAGAVDAAVFPGISGISGFSGKGILDIGLCGLFGAVEVAAAHLGAGDPEFAHGADGEAVELLVDDIEFQVVQRLTDGNVQFVILYPVFRDEDDTFRRAVDVVHLVIGRRIKRREFLATHRQITQRMVLDIGGELVAHLRGDERMGDALAVEVFVQVRQIQADVVPYDVDTRSAGQGGVKVHHADIKTVAGVGGHLVARSQLIVFLIALAESHYVAVLNLAAFGSTRRAGGVEEDEEGVGGGISADLGGNCGQVHDVFRQEDGAVVLVDDGTQGFVGDEHLGTRILYHEVQTLGGIARVEGLVGAAGFQHTEGGNGHPFAARDDNRHHVFPT